MKEHIYGISEVVCMAAMVALFGLAAISGYNMLQDVQDNQATEPGDWGLLALGAIGGIILGIVVLLIAANLDEPLGRIACALICIVTALASFALSAAVGQELLQRIKYDTETRLGDWGLLFAGTSLGIFLIGVPFLVKPKRTPRSAGNRPYR